MKLTRREFLKATAATGAAAAVLESNILYQNPSVALAESDAPEEVKYTHCVQCNHAPRCGMKVILKEGKVFRIEKRENYPNTNICAKGLAAINEMYDPTRLLYPMKRTTPKGQGMDPGWERISWDEALATIAEKLNEVKEKYGAEKVLFCTGDPKEPRSAVQRLAYTFGSPNMGTESSTCYKACELATKLIYGTEWFTASGLATGAGPAAGKTAVCIVWGNNPAWCAPFSFNGFKNGKETGLVKYIVVDPRVTPTVEGVADVHLQIRPGTDGALALCFGRAIIESDTYDHDFIENWAHGFEEYKEYVQEFTVEKVAEICQVPAERIQAAIDILVNREGPIVNKTAAAFGHHTNGVNNYRAISLLVPLTGSLDVPGGLSIPNEPLNLDEWWNTFEFARSKELLPKLDHLRVDREYFPVWADTDQQGSVQLNKIPEYVKTGAIRAAFMLGHNTRMFPQSKEYQEALDNMDFAVSADFYINPWTHDHCDMILPAAMSFERSQPLEVFGRRIMLREPIVTPEGEARPDYRICCDVGTALGYGDIFWNGGDDAEINCCKETLRTLKTPKREPITYEELKAAGIDGITIPMEGEAQFKKYELGLLREDGQPGFSSPTGKVEFTSEILREHGMEPLPVYIEPEHSPISAPEEFAEYPLILCSGPRLPIFTHSKQRHAPWVRNIMPDPFIRMYPTDAEERGLADGDDVIVSSKWGEIKCKLQISVIEKPGVVDMMHGWHEASINDLIPRSFDPISGFPCFKEGLCQIRKA